MKHALVPSLMLAFSLSAAPLGAAQAAWPEKPIRIVVPFAAGSFTSTAARAVAAELTNQMGQPVIVENRGGAGSTIGTDAVAKAEPDGYTFLLTDNSFAVSAALYPKLPYDPLKDIRQVTPVAEAPAVLVARKGLPAKNLKEVADFAKQNPGKLNFGSGGQGSSAHLAMEAFLLQNDLKLTHIPFKGVAAAILDIIADRVDIGIGSIGSTGQPINGKQVTGLAISGKERNPMIPDVPTFAEAGYPDYDMMYWFGVMAPGGTPDAIVDRLSREIATAIATPKVADIFRGAGVTPLASSPDQFKTRVHSEIERWKDVIVRAKVQADQ